MKIDVDFLKNKVSEWNCELVVNKNSTKSHKYFVVDKKTTQVLVSAYMLEDAEKLFDQWVSKWKSSVDFSKIVLLKTENVYSCCVLVGDEKRYVAYNVYDNTWRCSGMEGSYSSFMCCLKNIFDLSVKKQLTV
ncbi:hypothetical protein [Dolichospermum phage Dfl-JY23]